MRGRPYSLQFKRFKGNKCNLREKKFSAKNDYKDEILTHAR